MKKSEFKKQLNLRIEVNLYKEDDPLAQVINQAIDVSEDQADFDNNISDAIYQLNKAITEAQKVDTETLED